MRAAEDYGAYVPVLTNGVLSAWHYDSGAGISQFNLDAAKELAPFLEKADWDEVDFVSARDVSRVGMTLYRVKSCCLMQMESGVRSNVGSTLMVCNPELQTYDRLLGLNTMKMLQLSDRHATDMVIDPVGRPFRKYSHRRLPQLLQSIKVWNGKHAPRLPMTSQGRKNSERYQSQETPDVVDITEAMLHEEDQARRKAEDNSSAEVLRTLFQVSERASSRSPQAPGAKEDHRPDQSTHSRHENNKGKRASHRTPLPKGQPKGKATAVPKPGKWWPDIKAGHNVKIRSSVFKGMREAPEESKDVPEPEVDGEPERSGHGQVVKEKHVEDGVKLRPKPKPPWQPDPTPPWLKERLVFKQQSLPDSPVQIQPDFYRELRAKAMQRWSRPFHVHAMAHKTRVLHREKSLRSINMWQRGSEIIAKACLVVPGPKSLRTACKAILRAQKASKSTCALFLVPEDMLGDTDTKDFFHAYCKRGESYRCGPMFRKGEDQPWLHLNQAVHEFWMDPDALDLPELARSQRLKLKALMAEFDECLGDSNTSNAKRQSQAKAKIPYVRLPVKAGYERQSDAPFKKNPKI